MLSLGKFPEVSLAEARKRRLEAAELLANDIDPADQKRMEKARKKEVAANTFQAVAQDWKEQHLSKKSPAHLKRTWSMTERCILPYIGKTPIRDVQAADILAVARIHEKRGTVETAQRVIQISGQIIRWGMALGVCEADPTPALKGQIQNTSKRHMAATTDLVKVGEYLRMFDSFNGSTVVAAAVRLLPPVVLPPW
jgi:hypothetical protein